MAYDNRPNLSNRRFEQSTGDTLTLCGVNNFYGVSGINSTYGYRISGVTFLSAGIGLNSTRVGCNAFANTNATAIGAGACAQGINSISIGCGSYASGNSSIVIGKQAVAFYGNSIVAGCENVSCSLNGNILGGYGNMICSGNTNVTLIGINSCILEKDCYLNTVIVPNITLASPSGVGDVLIRDSSTGNIALTNFPITGGTCGIVKSGSNLMLGGTVSTQGIKYLSVCCEGIFGIRGTAQYSPQFFTTTSGQNFVGSYTGDTGYQIDLISSGSTVGICVCTSRFKVETYDSSPFAGIQYGADFSANYTSRSLVDKEYVDTHAITGGTCGVCKSGSNLVIGGVVTASGFRSLAVCGTGFFDICGGGSNGPHFMTTTGGQNFVGGNGSNCGYQISLISSGSSVGVCARTSKFIVGTYCSSAFAGIQYNTDYSTNYTNRSLVDKEYVDTHGGSGGSGFTIACNGLTSENLTTVKLGGALSNNTSITGAYTLSFTGGTQLNTQYGLQISGVTMFRAPSSTLSSVYIGQCTGTFAPTNTGINNIGIGPYALYKNCDNGNNNVAIGFCALCCNTIGYRNVAIGCMALANNSVGASNVGIGVQVLYCNYCGVSNVGVGTGALYSNLCGRCNVAIGYTALCSNTNGSSNIAIGFCTLCSNIEGSTNIGIGTIALNHNSCGICNIGIGVATLNYNVSGSSNIAIGTCAGFNETGSNKLYIANSADKSLIYGEFDNEKLCFRGELYASGLTNSTKSNVIYYDSSTKELTYGAAPSGGTGGSGFTIACNGLCGETSSIIKLGGLLDEATTLCLTSGSLALAATSVGASYQFANSGMILSKCNSCIYLTNNGADFKLVSCYGKCINIGNSGLTYGGDYSANAGARWIPDKAYVDAHAGSSSGIGWSCLSFGSTVAGCGTPVSTSSIFFSTLFGVNAGKSITNGTNNNAFGACALSGNTSGCNNVAIGSGSLLCNTTGYNNIANGNYALHDNKTGHDNIAIGNQAMHSSNGSVQSIGIGSNSLSKNTGLSNIGIGFNALAETTYGATNIGIGDFALANNVSGGYNTVIGYNAFNANICGSQNTVLGNYASTSNSGGSYNTVIGYGALCNNVTGSSNVILGYKAGYYETGSSRLHIANCCSCSLIYGEFDNKRVCLNGTLEVSNNSGANYLYLGDKDTNGSWRFVVSGSSLVVQVRTAGVWGGNKVLAP